MPAIDPAKLTDEDLIPDLLKEKPEPVNFEDSTIIVDGCPKVKRDKYDKLLKVVLSKFSKFGEILYNSMPVDEHDETMGVVFIVYDSKKASKAAIKEMNNFAFDKKHTFLVSHLNNFDKTITVSDEYKAPTFEKTKDPGNLKWWLQNELCRDQFNITYKQSLSSSLFGAVYWSTGAEPILIKEKETWSNDRMLWSPQGSYFATIHQPGIIIWAGEEFVQFCRLQHNGVRFADYSPCENFLVTYSCSQSARNTKQSSSTGVMSDVIVWNIAKAQSMGEFTMPYDGKPVFKWSHDDAFAACLVNGTIYIYETKEFTLLEKKISVSENKISSFSWSPTEELIAYWVPEKDSTPARCVLMNTKTWQEVSTKNLFSVAEIQLHWQDNGDYLAVEVLRCAKKKQTENQVKLIGTFVNFEILRLREKGYPWDKLEIKDCTLTNFQWEPSGARFSFVTTHNSSHKNSVSIFQMMKSGKIKECAVMERANARINELKWAPKGGILAVSSLHSADSYIEFIDATECHSLSKQDHAMLSEIYWDPTGRYLASCVLHPQKNDNAVWFWSCTGRLLHKMSFKQLETFSWRPRPPCLLTAEEIANVKKTLPSKIPHFENEDKLLASKASRELLEKRQQATANFTKWRMTLLERFEREKGEREKIRVADAGSGDLVEETIEVFLERQREIYLKNEED